MEDPIITITSIIRKDFKNNSKAKFIGLLLLFVFLCFFGENCRLTRFRKAVEHERRN